MAERLQHGPDRAYRHDPLRWRCVGGVWVGAMTKIERLGFVALAWALAVIVYGGAVTAGVIAVEWAFVR